MVFTVENLCKSFQGKTVLDNVSFCVESGDIVSLVGPSGVGKTTLLRILAGLEKPDCGKITFATPPCKEHPVIMVFQDYLLFPNLTVFENTAFALKARKLPKAEIKERVLRILHFFHLENKSDLYPNQLSGGQKQRVAIARAMVVNPTVLLLDEPFANLDRNLKMETAEFIRDTQKAFGVTTVSVTHDLEEAFAMSDKLGIMLDGKLVQYATPGEVYHSPATSQAANFLGPVNTIPAELCKTLSIPLAKGEKVLTIRPEALTIHPDSNGPAVITQVTFGGHYIKYRVAIPTQDEQWDADTDLIIYSLHNTMQAGDNVAIGLNESHHM